MVQKETFAYIVAVNYIDNDVIDLYAFLATREIENTSEDEPYLRKIFSTLRIEYPYSNVKMITFKKINNKNVPKIYE